MSKTTIMKKTSFSFFILCIFAFNIFAQEDASSIPFNQITNYEIGGIEVVGNIATDEELIISIAGLKVGNLITIPGADVYRAMKSLWSLKLFSDVEIVKQKEIGNIIFLEIIVEEKKRLNNYTFQGVKKVHETDLHKLVDNLVLKGAIISKSLEMTLTEKITKFYREKGFLDVVCTLTEKEIEVDPNKFDLLFEISLAKKVKVAEINFPDSEQVNPRLLRKKMEHTHVMNIPFGSSKLVYDLYEQDKKSVITYYNSLGYRDAKITKDSIYRNEKDRLQIDIHIAEGRQYYIGDIEFSGNAIYTDALLSEVLAMRKGDVFNTEMLNTNIHLNPNGLDISTLYMDNGYLFFNAEVVETGIIGDKINLQINIREGTQATIGKVIITGNSKTKDQVIRRELRTKPGRLFSRSDIIRSQREIVNLGFFVPEELGINTTVNPQDGTVDIEYIVKEKNSTQLELSGGWGGIDIGVTGTLGVSFNNFSLGDLLRGKNLTGIPQGDGQSLSLRAQTNGTDLQSYNFAFSEPWLGGKKPTSLTFGGYYTKRTNSESPKSDAYASLEILGGSVGLGTRLRFPDDNFVSFSSLSIKQFTLNKWEAGGFTDQDGHLVTNGVFTDISFKQNISRSTLNHPIFPTQGSRVSLTGAFTLPYSLLRKSQPGDDFQGIPKLIEYHKWRLNAEWYTPVIGKLIFKASVKAGLLGRYNKKQSTSPFGQFILGGDGLSTQTGSGLLANDLISLRGYDTDELDANKNGSATFFTKYTAELRYPVIQIPQANVYALAFAEAGNSWDSLQDYNPFDLKKSAGLGLRIHLPAFGTIGFDYGIGFDRADTIPGAGLFTNYGKVSIILGTEPE